MPLWIRLGLNEPSVLLVMMFLRKPDKNWITNKLNGMKEALAGKIHSIDKTINGADEIKSEVAEIKDICLGMEQFLASEEGQARIRELRQSR